ncbi:MAG: Zn-dependent hydrolase [Oscillospiraceae bacterium]|nr:Zn-dependent hydrolase [Oscillospiraceae bacterium]
MKKTYVTTMPDQAGAFLRASRLIAELGLNITRVSYNKAIDAHTLFIEVEGSRSGLEQATVRLAEIGCLQSDMGGGSVVLTEFRLRDVPGSVTAVLELIEQYGFNISYLSSQGNGTGWQLFKMGLFVERPERFSWFLEEASLLCPVRVIDYDKTEKILDNSIFYISFANELAGRMELPEERRMELVIDANRAMQLLDERGESFHKTFDYIRGFGEALARCRGDAFQPRVTGYDLGEDLHMVLIEPPCGSNTCVLRHQGRYLFIDTGYACYRREMLALFRRLLADFDTAPREALITHADVDHCGLLDLFDAVYLSRKSRDSLLMERTARGGFRERNPLHAPYIRICKALTAYQPASPEKLRVIAGVSTPQTVLLEESGRWSFGDLDFQVWEGQGGHLPGELVLIERQRRLVFTGDILVNIHGLTEEQAHYNHYAPYLMTSVDTDPALCALERKELRRVLGPGNWSVFGGHGPKMELQI